MYFLSKGLEDYMLPCLNKKLLGFECMGCGLQRSINLLLQGEFIAAFKMYPAIYTIILLFGFIIINHFKNFKYSNKIIIILAILNVAVIIGSTYLNFILNNILMEKQKLPNATVSLVLAILSFIGCCCTSGIGGVILSGIALFLTKKDENKYAENPDLYDNYGQVKTAKIIAIISLILSVIIIGIYIYLVATGQYDEMMEQYMEMLEEMKQNQ